MARKLKMSEATSKKDVPGDLPGMQNTIDEVGKAALVYVDACECVEKAKEQKERDASSLCALLRKHKRASIRVKGTLVTLKRVEKDVLKCQHPKDQ